MSKKFAAMLVVTQIAFAAGFVAAGVHVGPFEKQTAANCSATLNPNGHSTVRCDRSISTDVLEALLNKTGHTHTCEATSSTTFTCTTEGSKPLPTVVEA